MSDNGEHENKSSLSQEERVIKRRKLWEENPDDFIHISELVIGTRVLASGQLQCIIGMPNQFLLEMSCTRIQYETQKVLAFLETEARKKQVMPVKGGIMDFVRRK